MRSSETTRYAHSLSCAENNSFDYVYVIKFVNHPTVCASLVELHGRGEEGLQEQGEIEDNYTIGLPGQNMAQPHHVWGPGVSLEHNEEGSDVEEREENDIENHPNIPIPHILQHQHVWGSGESLGRHPYNPHAIDPVIHAESAAEAAEARSRIQIGRHEGTVDM